MQESESLPGDAQVIKLDKTDVNYRLKAGAFLTAVTGFSAAFAFGMTLAAAKRKNPKMFQKGLDIHPGVEETGPELALRALKWGTFYAVSGTSLIAYGIWKLSGAKTMEEFRYKCGNILPKIPKKEKPEGRTEFSGLNDLLSYVSSYKKDDKTSKGS